MNNRIDIRTYIGRAREFVEQHTPQWCRTALRRTLAAARAEPAVVTGIAWGLFMLARLFVGGAIGMADNFDGHRLMCQLGVAPHPTSAGQPLWAYITPRYDSYRWYGEACSAGGTGQPYLSTEYFPLLLAKLLTSLYGLPGALDLRMLGVIFAAGVAFAVGWTVRELPGPTWARVLIASGIGLAAADSAIAPYFISPFSEPAVLLGMLLLIPALLRLLSRERLRVRDIVLVAAIAAWTIGAKTQMASLLLVIVPVVLLRPSMRLTGRRVPARAGRVLGRVPLRIPSLPHRLAANRIARRAAARAGTFLRWTAARTPALAVCALLVGATVQFQQHQPRWLNEIVRYDGVFRGILGHSPNVAGDLRALHLPADFAPAAGSSIVAANSASAMPGYPQFLKRGTFNDILTFYATHPLRLFGAADRGLTGVAATRPSYLGNYEAASGAPPYEKECRVCVAAAAFTLTEPFRWVVIPGLWIVAVLAGVRMARRRSAPARARGVGVVLASVSAATVAQFWLVMLTEGDSDIEKHMLLVVFGTMLLGPLLFATLAAADQARPSSTPSASASEGSDLPAPRLTAIEQPRSAAPAPDHVHNHDHNHAPDHNPDSALEPA